jgi:hypothetical protein
MSCYTLFFLLLNIAACTNLDEEVFSDITENNYKYVAGDASKVIGAAYANIRSWCDCGSGQGPIIAQGICSDEAIFPANGSGWDDGGRFRRMHLHNWNTEQLHINRLWDISYSGIILANRAIGILEKDNFPFAPNENKDSMVAEMRALRAYSYWQIMDNFGDAPLVTKQLADMPSNTARKDIFDFVVKELKESFPNLPAKKEAKNYGRYTQWAAKTLLANVYLNAEVYTGQAQWDACIQECNDIITSGQYALDENFSDPFTWDNEKSLENILVIPFDEIYAGGFNYHRAALHSANQKTFDLINNPWGAGAYKGVPQFIDTYDEDDERLEATWLGGEQYASNGTPLMGAYDMMNQPLVFVNRMPDGIFTGEAEGFRWLKYKIKMGSRADLNNDFVLFRLTQVYMMKAECLLRTGKADDAASIVTMIRERGFKSNPAKAKVTGRQLQEPSSYKYGTVTDYILTPQSGTYPEKFGRFYDELGWEFAGEACRRRDMIRFGHFTKASWLSHVPNGDYRTVFPIPQKVVDANPNIEQNPNYIVD